uniref:Uncharacterized protein n=1 Tax=Arundo donax TaxID=35708 RepID=A0A0A9AEK8_ARUDO
MTDSFRSIIFLTLSFDLHQLRIPWGLSAHQWIPVPFCFGLLMSHFVECYKNCDLLTCTFCIVFQLSSFDSYVVQLNQYLPMSFPA